ncbi:hypothetical protein [Paenirhodobacter populi]|uniref:hypothetical protein n=1 Tax=Paenirhodobacter populi TaxID=2306993 RepID=UPI0013E29B79|nr:hypothetical protein [Sinirhodobacter populi]
MRLANAMATIFSGFLVSMLPSQSSPRSVLLRAEITPWHQGKATAEYTGCPSGSPLGDLCHRITPELVAEVASAHHGLLASKLAKKVPETYLAATTPGRMPRQKAYRLRIVSEQVAGPPHRRKIFVPVFRQSETREEPGLYWRV